MKQRKEKNVTAMIDWENWEYPLGKVPSFSMPRQTLADALKTAEYGLAGKTTLPVLTNILLIARNGRVRLYATDLDVGVVIDLPANVEEEGAITLPGKLLSTVVSGMIGDSVKLTSDLGQVSSTIVCGRQSFQVNGIETDEFPTFKPVEGDTVVLPANELLSLLSFVINAADTNTAKPALSGVSISFGDKIRVSASDGFRLHHIAAPNETGIEDKKIIIPAKSVKEVILQIFSPKGDPISIAIGNSTVVFRQGNKSLTVRQIEGPYPDVARIIPPKHQHLIRVAVEIDDLGKEIKLAELAATNNTLRLSMKPSGIDLNSKSPESSSYNGFVLADVRHSDGSPLEGEGTTHAVNVKYLKDALQVLGTRKAVMYLQKPEQAVCVRECDGDDGKVVVIMPLQPK